MIRTTTARALIAFAVVALILGAIPLSAQESKTAQGQEPKVAQGQLTRVDTEARTLAIQSSQGSPMVFRYTDQTKVIGADKGVAGLATMAGAPVTVQFVQQDKDNVATQIEIRQKQ
jgi:hypothetical protein